MNRRLVAAAALAVGLTGVGCTAAHAQAPTEQGNAIFSNAQGGGSNAVSGFGTRGQIGSTYNDQQVNQDGSYTQTQSGYSDPADTESSWSSPDSY